MKVYKKICKGLILSLLFTIFNFSCVKNNPDLSQFFQSKSPETEQEIPTSTKINPAVVTESSFICEKKSPRQCWQLPQCKVFCNNIFRNKKEREHCYKWPPDLYPEFENLFQILETETFDKIDPKVLKCFLDISEEHSDVALKKLKREDVKDLLHTLAEDPELASSFYKEEEKKFPLLHSLYRKIGGRTSTSIKKPIHGSSNFLILISENENKPAWKWLNAYIFYRCKTDQTCKEPLDYYCTILKDENKTTLTDFFQYREFEKEYQREIESKSCGESLCQYGDVQNFRSLCQDI